MRKGELSTSFILVAGEHDTRVSAKPNLSPRLRRFSDGQKAIDYMRGDGKYADRSCYPIASLLVLELRETGRSRSEVLKWLLAEPAFQDLSVVVLTESEAIPIRRKHAKLHFNRLDTRLRANRIGAAAGRNLSQLTH